MNYSIAEQFSKDLYSNNLELYQCYQEMSIMPQYVILNIPMIIRNIQSVFPYYDVSPLVADFIEAMTDTSTTINRIRNSVKYYFDALRSNRLLLDPRYKSMGMIDYPNKQVQLINNLDYGIVLEQAAMDIYDHMLQLGLYIDRRYLCYKLDNINADGSIILQKHLDIEDLSDCVFGGL